MQTAPPLPLSAVAVAPAPPPVPPEVRWASNPAPRYRKVLSVLIAVGPPVAAVFVTVRAIGEPIPWLNLILLTAFYFVIAHGVTIGFHRLFTHRSFEARRPLKIVLAVLGSMSFQGSLIGWVADHRRHHRYADRTGDPHSPVVKAGERLAGWRGMAHAHFTWVFDNPHTPRDEFAPDLLADRDLVFIDRMFVPLCIATLALPFGLGYALDRHARRGARRAPVGRCAPGRARAPPHVGDQLRVPPLRAAAVPHPRPEHELRSAGPPDRRRVLAQRAPRVPDAGAPRGRSRPARHVGPVDPVVRTARMGDEGALARPAAARRPPRHRLRRRAVCSGGRGGT